MQRRAKNERMLRLDHLDGEEHRPVEAVRYAVSDRKRLEVLANLVTAAVLDPHWSRSNQYGVYHPARYAGPRLGHKFVAREMTADLLAGGARTPPIGKYASRCVCASPAMGVDESIIALLPKPGR